MNDFTPELIAAALASTQTTFETSSRLPDDDGLVFVTAVPDAPLKVCGRLGRDGRWYIGSFGIVPPDGRADETAEIAAEKFPGALVLRDEPVAEAMIRYVINKVLHAKIGGLRRG